MASFPIIIAVWTWLDFPFSKWNLLFYNFFKALLEDEVNIFYCWLKRGSCITFFLFNNESCFIPCVKEYETCTLYITVEEWDPRSRRYHLTPSKIAESVGFGNPPKLNRLTSNQSQVFSGYWTHNLIGIGVGKSMVWLRIKEARVTCLWGFKRRTFTRGETEGTNFDNLLGETFPNVQHYEIFHPGRLQNAVIALKDWSVNPEKPSSNGTCQVRRGAILSYPMGFKEFMDCAYSGHL